MIGNRKSEKKEQSTHPTCHQLHNLPNTSVSLSFILLIDICSTVVRFVRMSEIWVSPIMNAKRPKRPDLLCLIYS